MRWRARIHTGDRVCSFSSTPPSCCLPFHLLLRSVYNTLRGSELITMRGCVYAGVSSRTPRNAAVTSSCLLHASERGREGGKKMTQPVLCTIFFLLHLFHPFGLRFPSSEVSGLFYCNEFGDGAVWKGGKGFKEGEKKKLEKFQSAASANIYTCTLAHLHASTPQTSNKGRPAARQLWAQQLGGDETQRL